MPHKFGMTPPLSGEAFGGSKPPPYWLGHFAEKGEWEDKFDFFMIDMHIAFLSTLVYNRRKKQEAEG